MSELSVILFHSTNHSIRMSNILKKNSIEHKMVPVPRHLSSDCGYCVRFKTEHLDSVMKIIEINNVEFDRIEGI
ncbi:MAG TPA: DUF3343 domain-containing protein [Spirochaetota bacterium]|nr:DUF3343 domain-containing protein [Spirochaetota bacterium]